ncbi:MAG: ApbE family protein [Marmoricola sp.]|nr:ApbE family protein [Marmoricola sp.]
MGLPISVLARGARAMSEEADRAVTTMFAELREVDQLFSPYIESSEVRMLARGEKSLEDCHPDVRDVAGRCASATRLTGGLFDPITPGRTWDPSGLVKGWAAERASRHLADVSDLDWCLNAGGDVVVLAPSGLPFTVGIQDPRDGARVLHAIERLGGAVATSGTAARGAHVYDPRSGASVAARWLSVTVVGPSLELADVLATAAFVAGDGWLRLLASTPGYDGLAIAPDGTSATTPGWATAVRSASGFPH